MIIKMIFLKSLYICSVFLSSLYSSGYAYDQEESLRKMLQERVLCFMVNTAAKLHRSNVENKIYDKNIIFSPMDLYMTTALAYLGAAEDNVRRKLNTILGIKTLEKFSELNPEFVLIDPTCNKLDLLKKQRKNLAISNDELSAHEIDPQEYYDHLVNAELGNMYRSSLKAKKTAIRSGLAIFVDLKYNVKNTFIEDATTYYDVDVKCVDFVTKSKSSTHKINTFIKNQTYNRVTELFKEPLAKTTRTVLSSTPVFIANWQKMFQPNDSYETAFHTRDGECDDCDDVDICVMMNQGKISYYSDPKVTAIALPMGNPRISMYYVVPRANQSLSQIISQPNKNFVKRIIDGVEPKLVVYQVPKMTFPGEIDFWDVLRASSLSNVTTKLNNIADQLTLSVFKQKIVLQVNEEGIGGCPINKAKKVPQMYESIDPRAVQFIADRPFIFFIYDSKTKMFLFYGAVFKPTGYTDF